MTLPGSGAIVLALVMLVAALAAAAFAPNRLVARKLRLTVYLLGAFLILRVVLAKATLAPELASQVEAIHYLLFLLAIINTVVVAGVNPLRQDRVPDRFPAIVQDAIVIGLFLVAATLIFPEKLLAASAVSAVIVGFALQDTLGNAFAGLAIQIEKPFRVGHWISVAGFEGRVSEITWRATRLHTRTGDFVIVPNSTMSKEAITNYSEPLGPSRLAIEVGVSYDAAPTKVKAVMLDAVRQAPIALAQPAPDVLLMHFGDSSITYRARVWIADYRYEEEAIDQVRTAIYYCFRRNSIEIPYPIAVEIGREEAVVDQDAALQRRHAALAKVPMFGGLTDDERRVLAAASSERVYGSGEPIVRQGDSGESMFVVLDGSVRVYVEPSTEVAVIESGGCFGEMSLLTGDPRTASVAARTDCVVVEIAPDAFNQIASANPAAVMSITTLASERRGPLEQARLAAATVSQSVESAGLLARVRRWMSS